MERAAIVAVEFVLVSERFQPREVVEAVGQRVGGVSRRNIDGQVEKLLFFGGDGFARNAFGFVGDHSLKDLVAPVVIGTAFFVHNFDDFVDQIVVKFVGILVHIHLAKKIVFLLEFGYKM